MENCAGGSLTLSSDVVLMRELIILVINGGLTNLRHVKLRNVEMVKKD